LTWAHAAGEARVRSNTALESLTVIPPSLLLKTDFEGIPRPDEESTLERDGKLIRADRTLMWRS
jgi:hypothetical protein